MLACLVFAAPVFAQEEETETRSRFTRFVESQLSSDNRQIRLNGIQGALSSEAVIGEITIADREGVWLRIVNARIEWTRTALLRGRLEIDRLAADSIEVTRKPLPSEEVVPDPEAGGFSVPELPVAVRLDVLEVPRVTFGPTVFGLQSELAVAGGITLAGGALEANLDIERLDGPGGELALALAYANETEQLDLDLQVSEPADGIVANLLSIEGRPAVDLALTGSGPVDDLTVDLALDADGERVVTGRTTLQRGSGGLAVNANVEGPLARLVAPTFRDFFGPNTNLTADALIRDGGGVTLNALSLETGALSLNASAETSEDNFLRRLSLQAAIEDGSGQPVVLPVSGGQTTVRTARLAVDYGAEASDQWSGALNVADLSTETLDAQTVELDFGGLAQNLDRPEERRLTFRVDGGLSGITADDPAVQAAIGDALTLLIDGAWTAGAPVELAEASLSAEALSLYLAGSIDEYVYDGTIAIAAESLAPFAELADRPLQGALTLDAEGTLSPLTGGFDLTFDGAGEGLQIGTPAVDALIESPVELSGRLARTERGFEAGTFTIGNEQFSLQADGTYSSERADMVLEVMLADLALVSDQASGRLELRGTANGEGGPIALDLQGSIPSGSLAGRRLVDAAFGFTGNLVGTDAEAGEAYGDGIEGALSADAFLDGEAVRLSADIRAVGEARTLSNLDFSAGGATITGNVAQDGDGLLTGEVDLDAPDIATLAALALQQASGSAQASIVLSAEGGEQNAAVGAALSDVEINETRIASATLDASLADLFGVPKIEGTVDGSDIVAGGVTVESVAATASRQDQLTDFTADATLEGGTDIALAGALEEISGGFRIALENARLQQGPTEARLLSPATITVEGERIEIGDLALDVDGGEIRASGVVADTLDLDVAIEALPLSIANTVMPDLDAAGTVDGTARVAGTRDDPDIVFDLTGSGLTAAPVREFGLGTIDLEASGRSAGSRVELDASLAADGGIAVDVSGSAPLGEGELDLDLRLDDLPLATIDALAGNQGLRGSVSATAAVGGTIAAPDVRFDVDGNGVSANALADLGIDPLTVAANGRFADQRVTLQSATVANGQGIDVAASGTVPLDGGSLNLQVRGNAPLSLANRPLAERGTRVEGALEFSVGISGPLTDPQFSGMVSASNAGVIDPDTNVQLQGITVLASIEGQQVTINTFTANLSTGGTITIGGTVSLDAASAFPANISITLDETRYADGDFLIVTASGGLTVTGPLARDPVIAGTINVDRAELGIPEGLGGGSTLTDVRHIAPPADVQRTLQRAGTTAEGEPPTPTARPSIVRLDITVNAPRRIFVRGRGLDAELGGSIRLQGPVTSIEPVGAFELVRGRLSILGRRITFDDGSVTLIGDLDPFVNLTATSQSGDTTVIITVSGRASDIDIDFSSQPALPEDEVIARLIFDRSISELSAFQIAQLAAAVAELSGGQNTSLLGSLRQSTGLDDLDVVTDEEGNAAVRAGRYVRDNVYLGVQAGSGDSSEVTIDLDITENLKARGAAGADGDTSLGLFYERDY